MKNFNKMTICQRLKLFVDTNYSKPTEFAEFIGVKYLSLYRYINGINYPSSEILHLFKKGGLSIEWLIDGSGSMYARNSKGLELLEKTKTNIQSEKIHPYQRIKSWIEENYGSFKNFSLAMDIDYTDLGHTLYDHVVPEADFDKMLDKAGCNVDWVLSGEGSMYAKNPLGEILQSKKLSSHSDDDNTSKKKGQLTDNKKVFNFNDLINIVRLAIRAELKNNEFNDLGD